MEIVIGIIVVLIVLGFLLGGSKEKQPSMRSKLDGAIMYAEIHNQRENIHVDADLHEFREFCQSLPEFENGQGGAFSLDKYTSNQGYGPYLVIAVHDRTGRGGTALCLHNEEELQQAMADQRKSMEKYLRK